MHNKTKTNTELPQTFGITLNTSSTITEPMPAEQRVNEMYDSWKLVNNSFISTILKLKFPTLVVCKAQWLIWKRIRQGDRRVAAQV